MNNDRKRNLDVLKSTTQSLSQSSNNELNSNSIKRRREEKHEQKTVMTLWDRRISTDDDVSLYSLLRCWTRDDPQGEKERIERERNAQEHKEKPTKTNRPMDNVEGIHLLITGEKILSDYSVLFENSKFSKADAHRRLHEHVLHFKKIRNRSKLVVASRYSKLRDQFAAKQIPPLAALEMILEDCKALSNGSIG